MHKRSSFLPYFFLFFFLSLILIFSSKLNFLKPVYSFSQAIFAPFQSLTYQLVSTLPSFSSDAKVKVLEDENKALLKQLVETKKIEQDNKALRDQFQTTTIKSGNLVVAKVIGAPGLIPGFSVPDLLIIDRGDVDGIRTGQAVIYKDNLIGKITKTSKYLSSVTLLTNPSLSFTANTLATNAMGVIKGEGGRGLIFDNVLLSETLKKDDFVLTKGDVNQNKEGFVPGLIVGKIASVSKNASDLFQKAEVKQLVDLTKLNTVFVIISF